MFDIGWGELLIIGGVALVVIKPKDLPGVLRTVGQTVGKIRRMAGEFQGQFQEALREANLDEARKTISGLNDSVSSSLETSFNPIQTIRDEIKNATEGRDPGLDRQRRREPRRPRLPRAAARAGPDARADPGGVRHRAAGRGAPAPSLLRKAKRRKKRVENAPAGASSRPRPAPGAPAPPAGSQLLRGHAC